MFPTRRLWGVVALGVALALFGALVAQPVMLAGAVGVFAWIVARQYRFARAVATVERTMTIDQFTDRSAVTTGAETAVTLSIRLDQPAPVPVTVTAGLPVGASRRALSTTLEPGTTAGRRTATTSWPVAGRHRFDPATASISDGLFETELRTGPTPAVTVEPPTPRTVHVGKGGDRVAAAYGQHDSGSTGSGITLAQLREYVPGDDAKRIDWNATARLRTPHVQEHEVETDRVTLLVFDHSASLGVGPPGETKLEYLREVALAVAANARLLEDPLGLVTIDDDGTTGRIDPSSVASHYTEIRRRLLALDGSTTVETGKGGRPTRPTTIGNPARPGFEVRELEAGVRPIAEDDAFARTLEPYVAGSTRGPVGEESSLAGTVERALSGRDRDGLVVILTDDDDPADVRRAVRAVCESGGEVLLLLAPTVLYERGGLADLDAAYERYVAVERFRRDLDAIDGVTALEVAPADRLGTVLDAARVSSGATGRGAKRRGEGRRDELSRSEGRGEIA